MNLETFLEIGLRIDGLYFLLGFVFAVIFLWKGIQVVDEGTEGTGLGFKLLLLPGMLVFWPVFLIKWIKMKKA